MNFCSDCGNPLGAPAVNTNKYTEDPPPTVFIGQSPPKPSDSPFGQSGGSGQSNKPNNPFDSPNTPNSPFGQPPQSSNPFGQGQQNTPPFTPNVQTPQFSPNPASPPQPPKKSNKGLIFGVVGCLGLLVLSVIGIAIVSFAFSDDLFGKKNNYPSPTPNLGNSSTPTIKGSPKGSTTPFDNKNTAPPTDDSDSSALLLSILESRKEVGKYSQTDAKTVPVKDYFPKGIGAAQATYSGGGKYVFLTVAKFDTMEDEKANFDDQIRGIKANGGKVTYQNTASDGTISAIYEKGGYYFAEYCNTNNYCNRIHSNNRDALRAFFQSYAGDK